MGKVPGQPKRNTCVIKRKKFVPSGYGTISIQESDSVDLPESDSCLRVPDSFVAESARKEYEKAVQREENIKRERDAYEARIRYESEIARLKDGVQWKQPVGKNYANVSTYRRFFDNNKMGDVEEIRVFGELDKDGFSTLDNECGPAITTFSKDRKVTRRAFYSQGIFLGDIIFKDDDSFSVTMKHTRKYFPGSLSGENKIFTWTSREPTPYRGLREKEGEEKERDKKEKQEKQEEKEEKEDQEEEKEKEKQEEEEQKEKQEEQKISPFDLPVVGFVDYLTNVVHF